MQRGSRAGYTVWMAFWGLLLVSTGGALAWSVLPVSEDSLVRMPGTQPDEGVTLESPDRCLNCHGDYFTEGEPGFNWKGSMMAQSARDFLFWACMTVAAQDSVWAVGTPNAVDICERCHFPMGWLEGRSDPPNASAMTGADFDGVQCDFCHRLYDPFFEDTYQGLRESADWLTYWDETNASGTPSEVAADTTYSEDQLDALNVRLFNGGPFFVQNRPASASYTENTSGQYFVSANSAKRASFADAAARHQMLYSRHHKSKHFCGTCHDVSNPVLGNLGQDGSAPLTTELESAHAYFHVERTYSEFRLSDYGQAGGAPGLGPFSPERFGTSLPDNNIARCQDCHMRDLLGQGCDKNGVPVRPSDSLEHPHSGLPLHDLTGGNAFVSYVLASAISGSPNYDPVNDSLLNQGPSVLTLDLTQGLGIDPVALLAGVDRAKQQLQLAASIENLSYSPSNGALSFRIQNQTGHKLISGFPEGRRMFVNVQAYAGDTLLYEVNPYDHDVGTLKGLDPHISPSSPPLAASESYVDELVFEMHPSSADLTGEMETFHFALATGRYKDNRIPPRGFRIAEAPERLSEPVWDGVSRPDLYTAAEYAGGYDDVAMAIVTGADRVVVRLFYQTTSREYVEFLRDEINGSASTLSSPTPSGEANAYIVQSDPFFSGMRAWGDTIWSLWDHNKNVPGAAPFLITEATYGAAPAPCGAPRPTLLEATPGNATVTLAWSDEHAADPGVLGYRIYYDQAGKAQLIAEVGLATTYDDTGLTNGLEYCYKVTSLYTDCESPFSEVRCAVPNNQGQARVGVSTIETGRYEKTGNGKKNPAVFVATTTFQAGDLVILRARVVDMNTGLPLQGATVELSVTGPESASLTSSPSDASGVAEASWQTTAPARRGQGGTAPGTYTATTARVTASGYAWDGVATSAQFDVQ